LRVGEVSGNFDAVDSGVDTSGDRRVEGVDKVGGASALTTADVKAGEVDQWFEGMTCRLGPQRVSAEVDVRVPMTPLPGQIWQTAVRSEERCQVVYG